MADREYLRPSTLVEAVELMAAAPGRRIVAGGTDLMVYIREGKERPSALVDVTGIPELNGVRKLDDGALAVGAAMTHSMIGSDPVIQAVAPLLSDASSSVGAVQIRNLATIGGNVVNGAVAADTLSALAAFDAAFITYGAEGEKRYTIDEFFLSPGKTAVGAGEILTKIILPPQPKAAHAFIKVARRRAAAISRLAVSVMANPSEGYARIAVGAVLPKPGRITMAEEALMNGFDLSAAKAAGDAAKAHVLSISGERPSMVYKLPVVSSAVEKAIIKALSLKGVK
ncbi:MAG: hypothetical protein C0608_00995 [Deltaproteobacteria bacterium]|nr:MAG: hypothetical protein C0608_00995 [Deltaproteobacteria bacterium]